MHKFDGFPSGTRTFLRRLSRNNDRAWFEANRSEYEESVLAPAFLFVEAAGRALRKIAPLAQAVPAVDGSIVRLHRDVRFSANKDPYKTQLGFWFWEGPERKSAVSGFFVNVRANGVEIGAGARILDPERLRAYRAAVLEPRGRRSLQAAMAVAEEAGLPVQGAALKTLPRGIPRDEIDPDALPLLLYAGVFGTETIADRAVLESPGIVDACVMRWKKLAPLHRWLVDTLPGSRHEEGQVRC